ncbi:FecCD family ABC transporter permease [Microbacterium sp. NPDC057944]|uniref:FecCD family ABC transporter permease n=1 Tax=Microbacterium sp. NPDC057944 TaxID=3346286 RepID=UPI0036DC55DA
MTPTALVFRAGRMTLRIRRRSLVVGTVLLVTAAATVVLALTIGAGGIPLPSLLHALAPDAAPAERLVFEWRGARAVAAVLFGGALAIGGAVFQTLTRNPLGSPDVIGLGAGSYAGVIAVVMVGGSGFLSTALGAFAGGLVAAALVYGLAYRKGTHGFRLVVVGIAVGAILRALTSWFTVKADLDAALRAAIWDAGSLYGMTWPNLAAAAAALLIVTLAVPLAARRLPLLDLGDDAATALGLRVEPTKAFLVVLGVAATAIVTAVAGPISFIALAAPQIARRLTSGGTSLTASALVGAALLGGADLVAQHLIPGVTLPVGGVTVVIGGTYLIWLLIREGRKT